MLVWHIYSVVLDKLKRVGWIYLFSLTWLFLFLVGAVKFLLHFVFSFCLIQSSFHFIKNTFVIVFIDLVLFSPTPNEKGFPIKNRSVCWSAVELFFRTLLSKSLSEALLLIASIVWTGVLSDGADSMLFVEHWFCCLFNW